MKTIMGSCTRTVQLRYLLLVLSRTTGLGDKTATLAVCVTKSFAEAPGTRALVESAAPRAGLWARVM